MNNTKPSYAEIAQSLNLWRTYVDIDGNDSEQEFESGSWQERVIVMEECFGPEADGGMVEE
jgi:hypothetical protein